MWAVRLLVAGAYSRSASVVVGALAEPDSDVSHPFNCAGYALPGAVRRRRCLSRGRMAFAAACVPVGEAPEPQFLYGPICFVLFVLLINEITGAACWDGPAVPLCRPGPLSHALPFSLSKWIPCLSFPQFGFSLSCSLFFFCFRSIHWLIWHSFFFYFCFPVGNTGGCTGPREVTIVRRLV